MALGAISNYGGELFSRHTRRVQSCDLRGAGTAVCADHLLGGLVLCADAEGEASAEICLQLHGCDPAYPDGLGGIPDAQKCLKHQRYAEPAGTGKLDRENPAVRGPAAISKYKEGPCCRDSHGVEGV